MRNALFPKEEKPPIVALGRIPIERIIDPADGSPPTKALVDHIREFGVIEAITVAKRRSSNLFFIVSGRRRFAATKILAGQGVEGFDRIPTQEMILPDDEATAALILAMNRLRSSNPVADTKAAARLFAAGHSDAEIREATGLTAGEIKRLRALAICDGRLLRHVAEGRCSAARALKVAKLPPEAQKALLNGFDSELSENPNARLSAENLAEARSVSLSEIAVELPASLFASIEEIDARIEASQRREARPAEALEWIAEYADVLTNMEIAARARRALAAGRMQ